MQDTINSPYYEQAVEVGRAKDDQRCYRMANETYTYSVPVNTDMIKKKRKFLGIIKTVFLYSPCIRIREGHVINPKIFSHSFSVTFFE